MKTKLMNNIVHTLIITAIVVASIVVTRNIFINVKHLYQSQAPGAGINCFFDLLD